MGLTKQYLRYVPGPIFNVIASLKSNAVFVELRAQVGRYVAAGACENVIIWDSKTGEKVYNISLSFVDKTSHPFSVFCRSTLCWVRSIVSLR